MSFQPGGLTSESTKYASLNAEENSSSGWNRASNTSGWSKTSPNWTSSNTSGWLSSWGSSSNSSGLNTESKSSWWNAGSNSSRWGSESSDSTSKEQSGWGSTFISSIKLTSISFHFGTGKTFTSFADPSKPFEPSEINSEFILPTPPSKTAKTKKSFDLRSKPDIGNKTGEEDEEIQFNEKANVFTLITQENGKQEYIENSTAEIHVNYHPDKKRYRMIARLLSNSNLLINSLIIKEMNPSLPKPKTVRLSIPLVSCESSEPKLIIRLLQFPTEDIAQRFLNLLKDIISKL